MTDTGVESGNTEKQDGDMSERTRQRHSRTQTAHKLEGTRERVHSPPPEPTTLPSRQSAAFETPQAFDNTNEIKLAIEFPLKGGKQANDVALFFKRFMTVLMAANKGIKLLKWDNSSENPIAKAIDIAYDEDTISEYYSGMKMKSDRRRIVGFTRIQSPVPFAQIKKHTNFFHWLQTNKVWVRPTSLSSSKQAKVGWLLHSHATYTNQAHATYDLLQRMGNPELELELTPHTIAHKNGDDETIRTNALKVVTTEADSQAILDGLIVALTQTPKEFQTSSTVDFKLIPFRDNAIGRDGITELIERQNSFLHKTCAISVIDGGDGNNQFKINNNTTDHEGCLRHWAMNARRADDSFLFNSVECGRRGQTYYLCDKEFATEAEEWLDATFNNILVNYGAKRCLEILGGNSHVRRERNVRTTPQISAYLQNLNLSSSNGDAYKGNDNLSAPPARKKKKAPRIVYGSTKKSAWTKPIHNKEDSDEDANKSDEDANTSEGKSDDEIKTAKSADKAGIKRKQSAGSKKTAASNTNDEQKDTISQLHAAIAKANEERLTLEKATRDNLKDMEKVIMTKVEVLNENVNKITQSNKAMEDTVLSLHEGQLSMDNNIKMLMLKLGITTNATINNNNQETKSAATTKVSQEQDKWEHIDNTQADVGMDGAEEFDELTDEVFDNVLSQCQLDQRTHVISPHKKSKTSNPTGLRPGGSGGRK